MKSVQFTRHGGPEVLELVERPVPQPGPGEVLVKMCYAGISRPDYLMRVGMYQWTKGKFPFYPGQCGTGTVAAVGEGVTGFKPGDSVYVEHWVVCGCHAEYKLAPADRLMLLPDGTDLKGCALLSNYVMPWGMLRTCLPNEAGKTLYISGAAGPFGSGVVQLAPLLGLRVITSASTPDKCDYLRQIGAAEVFQYTEVDVKETILSLTDGQGADIILDQCVGPDFCEQLDYLAPMGTVLVYNHMKGFPEENVVQAMTNHFAACPAVRVYSSHYYDDKPEQMDLFRREVLEFIAQGKIRPHVGASFPLKEITEAHALLDSGKFFGGIILNI